MKTINSILFLVFFQCAFFSTYGQPVFDKMILKKYNKLNKSTTHDVHDEMVNFLNETVAAYPDNFFYYHMRANQTANCFRSEVCAKNAPLDYSMVLKLMPANTNFFYPINNETINVTIISKLVYYLAQQNFNDINKDKAALYYKALLDNFDKTTGMNKMELLSKHSECEHKLKDYDLASKDYLQMLELVNNDTTIKHLPIYLEDLKNKELPQRDVILIGSCKFWLREDSLYNYESAQTAYEELVKIIPDNAEVKEIKKSLDRIYPKRKQYIEEYARTHKQTTTQNSQENNVAQANNSNCDLSNFTGDYTFINLSKQIKNDEANYQTVIAKVDHSTAGTMKTIQALDRVQITINEIKSFLIGFIDKAKLQKRLCNNHAKISVIDQLINDANSYLQQASSRYKQYEDERNELKKEL